LHALLEPSFGGVEGREVLAEKDGQGLEVADWLRIGWMNYLKQDINKK
jgi:hypothetical protein